MTTNQCTHYEECNQVKRGVCIGAYEHCTVYQRFESLKTPADKIPTHVAKSGVARFRDKYPNFSLDGVTYDEWLGIGAIVKLPSMGESADTSTYGK